MSCMYIKYVIIESRLARDDIAYLMWYVGEARDSFEYYIGLIDTPTLI